jgi:hypothetical protein
VARIGAFLIHFRPFLPAWRNILSLVFILPAYALAVYGFLRLRKEPLAILLAGGFLGHLLLVATTFADWDGRFLLLIPYTII